MTIKQSTYITKGHITTPDRAGEVCEQIFTHTFNAALDTTDILELAALIPFGRILAVDLADENVGVLNWTIGYMSGTVGSTDAARTSGTELFAAQAAGTPVSMTVAALAALAANGYDAKSIGVKTSVNIAAGAIKKIHLRIRYSIND